MGDSPVNDLDSRGSQRRTLVDSERAWRHAFTASESASAWSGRDIRPAEPVMILAASGREWAATLWRRVAELGTLPRGWDSYGGLSLQRDAVVALNRTLAEVSDNVNSAPLVSLISDGGLLCEWQAEHQSVSLIIDGSGDVSVRYEHETSGEEWERPLDEVSDLAKKVWHSSL
jgi:hypothetical protein